jgi:hypothetical protein
MYNQMDTSLLHGVDCSGNFLLERIWNLGMEEHLADLYIIKINIFMFLFWECLL